VSADGQVETGQRYRVVKAGGGPSTVWEVVRIYRPWQGGFVSAALASSGAKPFDFVSVHFPERLLGRARAEFSHELAQRQIAACGRFGIVLVGEGLDRLALEETPVSHIPSRHRPAYHSFRVNAPLPATAAVDHFRGDMRAVPSSQPPIPSAATALAVMPMIGPAKHVPRRGMDKLGRRLWRHRRRRRFVDRRHCPAAASGERLIFDLVAEP
jgi:hypothetical protein